MEMKTYTGRDFVRFKVRVRDNFTCLDCGDVRTPKNIEEKKCKKLFDVHHINGLCGKKSRGYDSVKDMDNLITLCHKCHYRRPEHKCKSEQFSKKSRENSSHLVKINKECYLNIFQMRNDGYKLREIADKYKVTSERIRQILSKKLSTSQN